ncbi:hypothetical protein SDC9_172726 [bioreactor metagenome]|uniref:Uncharacterized protein n=1 Tax=bioreactor metagenome TaxID=1076179 RepID=A0A645GEJ3_9ZZZZ
MRNFVPVASTMMHLSEQGITIIVTPIVFVLTAPLSVNE